MNTSEAADDRATRVVQWIGLVVLGPVALFVTLLIGGLCWSYANLDSGPSGSGKLVLFGIVLVAPAVVLATFVYRRNASLLARLSTAALWVVLIGVFTLLVISPRI